MSGIITGLDRLELEGHPGLEGRRLGLLANQASLNRRLESARDVLSRLYPGQLKALFGPQHGFGGEDQDNMVETPHAHDAGLKIPVFSLYAESRVPSAAMFELIDTLVVDLQDVGTRVYTFSSTMLGCLRAAARYGKAVVVLDRPNPIGGDRVEGNLLEPELFSFVGPCSLPMRHGLTMGELALAFNQIFGLGCRIDVLSLKGWERTMLWNSTGLRWTMPSPNMPLPETAALDFNKEMRITREEVDRLLSEGKVAQAEAYMEERRQFLLAHGYFIRRLNQAYFAFHGTYRTSAAAPTEDPIGPRLQRLRAESPDLRSFLRAVRGMTSLDDLIKRVPEP